MPEVDIRRHLASLVGSDVETIGLKQQNRILELRGDDVIVATTRSPRGKPVPIRDVEAAWAALLRSGELPIEVDTVGYRSAFIGAVLAVLPQVEIIPGTRRLRLRGRRQQGSPAGLPPRSRKLIETVPLHQTESGVKACVELTIYADGHAGIAVSRIEDSPPRRRIVQADSLPLNDVDELSNHVLAVIERLQEAAADFSAQ